MFRRTAYPTIEHDKKQRILSCPRGKLDIMYPLSRVLEHTEIVVRRILQELGAGKELRDELANVSSNITSCRVEGSGNVTAKDERMRKTEKMMSKRMKRQT